MKTAAIIGGSGYTAGELIRILLNHPYIKLTHILSESHAGKYVHQQHTDLLGETQLKFTNEVKSDVDVVFLCKGHGYCKPFLEANSFTENTLIIDLSRDYRFEDPAHSFVYGLPELKRDSIKSALKIANPGCFATAIQLSIIPLLKHGLITSDVFVNGITGSTGAGHTHLKTTHFSWRTNNVSIYKAFEHQHLDEVYQTMGWFDKDLKNEVIFIPMRGNFTRGIFLSVCLIVEESFEKIENIYSSYYQDEDFVFISQEDISLKQVVNTNKCILHLRKFKNRLLVSCAIDNLLKGASGQAVQNMNIALGFEESTALRLKSIAF